MAPAVLSRVPVASFRRKKNHIHFNWFISISTWGLAPIAASRVHFATPSQREMGTLPRRPRWQVFKVTGSYRYLRRRFLWVTPADQSKPWQAQTIINCQTRPVLCGLSTCWQLAAGGWVDLAHTLHSRFSIWDSIYSTDHNKGYSFHCTTTSLMLVTAVLSGGTTALPKHHLVFFWWDISWTKFFII